MRAVGQICLKNLSAKLESFIGAEYERLGRSCQINRSKGKTFNVNNHDCGASKISCDATKAESSNYGFDGTTKNRLSKSRP